MAIDTGKQYTLPKGKFFFDRFPAGVTVTKDTKGEGERYIGSTEMLSMSSTSTTLDHFQSEGGIKTKDASVTLETNRSGKFDTANISGENLALTFQGDATTAVQLSATAVIDTVTVKEGRTYQLGASVANPTGVRNVSNVIVKKGATTVAMSGNYSVDLVLGRIYIEVGAPGIADNDELTFTYDVAASTRETVVSSSKAIYGAARFIADSPYGANNDIYLPYVKLQSDGDFSLKGDTWQTLAFTMEVLQKPSHESVYVDGRPV